MATKTKTAPRKPVPKFYGEIITDKGKNRIRLKSTYVYQRYLDTNFKAGQQVSVTIKRNYKHRTTGNEWAGDEGNQNGYLWAVVLPMISEATGYSLDEACDALETLLCKQGDNEYGMPKILRFKDMDTVQFNHYVIDDENPDSVRSWATRVLELEIPLPDKEWKTRGYAAESGDK